MTRSSFSVLFFIRESKARKNGNAPIETMITVNGERASFSTGKSVQIDKWDKAKQQVKGKDDEARSLNLFLQAVKNKLYEKETELMERGFVRRQRGLYVLKPEASVLGHTFIVFISLLLL